MKIRKAIAADNQALILLSELTAMEGKFVLHVERRPNFFSLLKERGDFIVFVAEVNNSIVGSIASSNQRATIAGKSREYHYISDLKVHPNHRNSSIAYRLAKTMYRHLISLEAEILISTSIAGNKNVHPFFNGRLGIPEFNHLGRLTGYHLLPYYARLSKKLKAVESKMNSNLDELSTFYNSCISAYVIAPFTEPRDLKNKTNLVIRRNNQIVAALSYCDHSALKQNVIRQIPPYLDYLLKTCKAISLLVPNLQIPQTGKPINLLYVSRMAAKPGHIDEIKRLIKLCRRAAFKEGHSFVSLALDSNDPLIKSINSAPKLSFKFNVWLSSLKNDARLVEKIQEGIISTDYSLI
jgi:hypothetical protein